MSESTADGGDREGTRKGEVVVVGFVVSLSTRVSVSKFVRAKPSLREIN